MTWFLVQDYITGRRVLSTPDISVPSPAQPFIKYSLPLVPCSWSIHGSRLAQRCNGLWGSSSANGLNGGQKHRGKIWQSKDPNGKPIRTQISMVTWTSQAHTTYSVCVYIHTYIYIYIYHIYIYIKLSQRMLFTYHFFGSGLVLLGAARINVFASSETFFQSAGLKLKLPKRTWPEAPKADKNGRVKMLDENLEELWWAWVDWVDHDPTIGKPGGQYWVGNPLIKQYKRTQ